MGRALKLAVVLIVVLVLVGFFLLPRQPRQPPVKPTYPITPPSQSTVLESLNGTIHNGREHATWIWSNLRDYKLQDPQVASYVEWLMSVLNRGFNKMPHRHGDYIMVDSVGYRYRQGLLRVDADRVVRMGFIRLPFGYGIIITGYQDNGGQISIAIHGTVVNETEFMELVVRSLSYPVTRQPFYLDHVQLCVEPTTPEKCAKSFFVWQKDKDQRLRIRVQWFLWRTKLMGTGLLESNGVRIPIREVNVLLEMPVLIAEYLMNNTDYPPDILTKTALGPEVRELFGGRKSITYSTSLELLYLILSHAAFGLASNFSAVTPGEAEAMTTSLLTFNRNYGGFMTPLQSRLAGRAVCAGFSTSVSTMASILGYPMVVVWLDSPSSYLPEDHVVGAFLRLSSLGERGAVPLTGYDLDGDGVDESYDVFVDTASYSYESLIELYKGIKFFYPPLLPALESFETPPVVRFFEFTTLGLTGVPQVVLGLPDWLKTPALIKYQWFTEMWLQKALEDYIKTVYITRYVTYAVFNYTYDPETDSLTPTSNETYYLFGILAEGVLVVEPAMRAVLRDKGIGPEAFTPPSATPVRGMLEKLPVIYEKTGVPETRSYVFKSYEYMKSLPPDWYYTLW